MKKMLLGLVAAALMTISLAAWAADEQTTENKDQTTTQQTRPRSNPNRPILSMDPNELAARREIRGRGPAQDTATRAGQGPAQEMYQNAMQRRQQQYEEGIKELQDLKKLAESENATKTAEAIQKMIDKRNEDYKKQSEEAAKRLAEFNEMMKQRQQQGTAGQGQSQNRPARTRQGDKATTGTTEGTTKTESTTK